MGARLLLLAAPPAGAALFAAAVQRLARVAPELPVEALQAHALGATAQAAATALAARLGPDVVLVAHGLAVPVARSAAGVVAPRALVLVNGPLDEASPGVRALCAGAGLPGLRRLVPAAAWTAWLRSSVGLRRAVNNPYVMDRDTVAAVAGVAEGGTPLSAQLGWLASLPALVQPGPVPACPTTLLWGDNDRLFPLAGADSFSGRAGNVRVQVAPGGRWLWPLEMPWAFADAVAALAGGGTATPTSRMGGSGRGSGGGTSLSSEEEAGLV